MRARSSVVGCLTAAGCLFAASRASAAPVTFESGSLILPMDVDYQDAGMLQAFGLLDKLLRAGVPVSWCIKTPKVVVDVATGKFEDDFNATAKDFKSGTALAAHGYRGGPFVIAKADAATAAPIVTAWQTAHAATAVHVASASFTANVRRYLTAAPRIAVLGDGNQGIAFSYLNAAGIPDDSGALWTNASLNLLTPAQVSGPTTTSHTDGALFRSSGVPAYCEIMTMHWNVTSVEIPEVTAEMAKFLEFPVHVNAECQAVNAVEGAPPIGGRSDFVSTHGFQWPAPAKPSAVQYSSSQLPFAQMDGPFGTIGGSEPAYALAAGSTYYDTGIVMVRGAGMPIGVQDVWMTGYAGLGCDITSDVPCIKGGKALGKVSYLGGHQYSVGTPMTTNPTTQGTRLFLNSLYEAGCVTAEGQPTITITKTAPLATATANVTYVLSYTNTGPGPALSVVLKDPIPTGSTFVSATGGGTFAAGTVTWALGDLAKDAAGSVSFNVVLGARGTYRNTASASFTVGLGTKSVTSNTTTTTWGSCGTSADCPAPLVCETTTSTCVECLTSLDCTGKGVCLSTKTCGCTADPDCGTVTSGRVCDDASKVCRAGCRGVGGNGCPVALACTSTTTAIGSCVAGDAGAADTSGTDTSSSSTDTSTSSTDTSSSSTDTAVDDTTTAIDAGGLVDGSDDAGTGDTGSAPDATAGDASTADAATDDTAGTGDDSALVADSAVATDGATDGGARDSTATGDVSTSGDGSAAVDDADAAGTDDPAAGQNGGCGCRVVDDGGRDGLAGMAAAGLLVALIGARRRRAA